MSDVPSITAEDSRVQNAIAQIKLLLIPSESLECFAVQRRIFALFHRRSLVTATTGRFIGISRGLFGGFDPQDIRWQDVKDARIRVGVFGADLMLTAYSSPDLAVAGQTRVLTFVGLRKEQAQDVYRKCQAQEQAWREKRRIRELEELRAKSGGIQLGAAAGVGGTATTATADTSSAATRLQQAKDMFEKHLISDSEYESLKARIVSSL